MSEKPGDWYCEWDSYGSNTGGGDITKEVLRGIAASIALKNKVSGDGQMGKCQRQNSSPRDLSGST